MDEDEVDDDYTHRATDRRDSGSSHLSSPRREGIGARLSGRMPGAGHPRSPDHPWQRYWGLTPDGASDPVKASRGGLFWAGDGRWGWLGRHPRQAASARGRPRTALVKNGFHAIDSDLHVMAIGADLLIHKALAGTARAKFDQVIILLNAGGMRRERYSSLQRCRESRIPVLPTYPRSHAARTMSPVA